MGSCTNYIFGTLIPPPFLSLLPSTTYNFNSKKLGTPTKPIKEKYEHTYLFFEDTFDN